VAGIQIRVHLSFFLLVPLFAAAGAAPGGPGELPALAWLAVVFGCVLLHELAHCLVGRPRGVVVHEIELLPLGGVSKLENLPENPRDEFAVAIAGPMASVAIGVVAGVVALALSQPLLPIELFGGDFLPQLFWFNLIIAAFNLLPAFPLDGGRVFRALLERHRDLEAATQIAARTGRAIAVVMVGVGVVWNVWIALIGVFVYFGAAAEEAGTIVHVRLRGWRVGDLMLLEPVVIDPTTTIDELAVIRRRSPQRVFPVVGADGFRGVVDAGHVQPEQSGEGWNALVLHEAPVVMATDLVEDCLPLVAGTPTHALVVLEGANVVGLLRIEEVQHLLADPLPAPSTGDDHHPAS
jgi:stage IV sporulation protein FB